MEIDNTFELIKSLNRNEKRYFNLFSSVQEGEKSYMQIFKLLDEAHEYSEEDILKQIEDPNVKKQYRVFKTYLYNNLLESLLIYNLKKDPRTQVKKHALEIKILYEKGLYTNAFRRVRKAKKEAYENELYSDLLDIIHFERLLIIRKLENYTEEISRLNEELSLLIRIIENINAYILLLDKISIIYFNNPASRSEKEIELLNEHFNSPLLSNEKKALSERALNFYYNILFYKYQYQDDHKAAHHITKQWVELGQKQYKILKQNKPFVTILGNYLSSCVLAKEFKDFPQYLHKLKSLKPDDENEELLIQETSLMFEIHYLDAIGDFNKALNLTAEVEQLLALNSSSKNVMFNYITLFMSAVILFLHKEYKKALNLLNIILNDKDEIREDLKSFGKLIRLLIFYEMKNIEVLNYEVNNMNRQYKKVSEHEFEKVFLKFMGKIINQVDAKRTNAEFISFHEQLTTLFQSNPFEKKALSYFNFLLWLQSKVDHTDMLQLLKEEKTQQEKVRSSVSKSV